MYGLKRNPLKLRGKYSKHNTFTVKVISSCICNANFVLNINTILQLNINIRREKRKKITSQMMLFLVIDITRNNFI